MSEFAKSLIVLTIGIAAVVLFIFYFAAEKDRAKRIAGTLLTLLLAGFGIFTITSQKLQKGIDLEGGAAFRVKIKPSEGKTVTRVQAEAAKEVIEKRLAPLGNKDIVVTAQGTDEIYVEVPGISPDEIATNRQIIEKVAKLEFRLVKDDGESLIMTRPEDERVIEPGWDELPFHHKMEKPAEDPVPGAKPEVKPEDAKLSRDEQAQKRLDEIYKKKQTIMVKHGPELSGKSVKRASVLQEPGSGNYLISVTLNDEFDDDMREITGKNLRKPLAIVVDNEVISAPTIQGQFGAQFQITGSFKLKEATDLASALENPLENPLEIIQASQTSPTYGKAIIEQGMNAGLWGIVATLAFMVLYYRLAGFVAVLGLTVNTILLIAAMVIFNFTLTMPGIAGIVLTLGIAVDANVLIYERMREEFAAGKTLSAAISASYHKAFSAIFDSNLTGLITSVIMIAVATGAVKGFGVTLTIGILASLFSALLITRVCFMWMQGGFLKKNLSFMSLIKNRLYDFMGQRKLWATVSTILIVASIAIIAIKGEKSLGYELRGGELISLKGVTEEQVSGALKSLTTVAAADGKQEEFSFTTQSIKPIGDQEAFVNVRTNFGHGDDAIAHLQKELKIEIKPEDLQTIGPAVGAAMLESSLWAVGLGFLGIFIYLAFRYELPFAIGGLVAIFHDVIIAAGVCALCGVEIGMILIGAFLTIAGYSINDTIVIFDRIRETLRNSRDDLETVMNQAISATLSRTILTSGVTLFVVLAMLLFGGQSMRDFSFAMVVGMISGTYSTIFIASPVVLWWAKKRKLNLRKAILDADMVKLQAQSGIEKEAPQRPAKSKPAEAS